MKILYGTTNKGKLQAARKWMTNLDIELVGLHDMEQPIPEVDESGKTPLENARLKADAYYQAFGSPVRPFESVLQKCDMFHSKWRKALRKYG